MGFLRSIGKIFPGTGRHAARRAERAANKYVAEAQAQREDLERRTKREQQRAHKLSIRALRSRRSAAFFATSENEKGSPTIG